MKTLALWIFYAGATLLLWGCSADYMPLGTDAVTVHAVGLTPPIDEDGTTYHAIVDACIGDAPGTAPCGVRLDPNEEYDDDSFVVSADDEEETMLCSFFQGAHNGRIQHAACKALMTSGASGQVFRVSVNEYEQTTVTLPEPFTLASSVGGKDVSVGSTEGIPITWEPSGSSDSMRWRVRFDFSFNDYADETFKLWEICREKGFDDVLGGDLVDEGSFVIPFGAIAKDLPDGGCPIRVDILRERPGTLDPGITGGAAVGAQLSTFKAMLKP